MAMELTNLDNIVDFLNSYCAHKEILYSIGNDDTIIISDRNGTNFLTQDIWDDIKFVIETNNYFFDSMTNSLKPQKS